MPEKQLSRVAGCPRLPLPIFKAAAEQYFVGKDATRSEQQNGKKSKVKLLRELSTNDPAVRSWLIKFAKEFKADQTRKAAAEQGLTIAVDGAKPLNLVDRIVRVLEAGQNPEDHFTAEELNAPAPADPEHDKLWADYQQYLKTGTFPGKAGIPTCNWCGGDWTRTLKVGGKDVPYCDRHDGKPTLQSPRTVTNDPATVDETRLPSSSDPAFYKLPARAQVSIIQRETAAYAAQRNPAPTNRADFGPSPYGAKDED